MKPSVTIPEKSQLNGSLSEPEIHGHSRPNVYQANIQYTNYTQTAPKAATAAPWLQSYCINSAPCFGSDQTAHSRPFSYQYTIYSINDQTWHPNSPNSRGAVTGCSIFLSKNSIHSVPSFGTDQTAPHGLIQPKHRKTLKNGNKSQVGRKSYLKELEETPDPRVHA